MKNKRLYNKNNKISNNKIFSQNKMINNKLNRLQNNLLNKIRPILNKKKLSIKILYKISIKK